VLLTAYCLLFFGFLLWRGFYDQNGTGRVSDNCFSGRTKDHSAKTGSSMRRNNDEINFPFGGDANNFGGGIAMHNNFFDVQAGALFAFRKFRQLFFSRVFQLVGDVGDGHWLGQTRISNRRNDRFDDVHANDFCSSCPRNGRCVRQSIVRASAKVRGKKNLVYRGQRRLVLCRCFQFRGILHAQSVV
jgi:hypothetical protein